MVLVFCVVESTHMEVTFARKLKRRQINVGVLYCIIHEKIDVIDYTNWQEVQERFLNVMCIGIVC